MPHLLSSGLYVVDNVGEDIADRRPKDCQKDNHPAGNTQNQQQYAEGRRDCTSLPDVVNRFERNDLEHNLPLVAFGAAAIAS